MPKTDQAIVNRILELAKLGNNGRQIHTLLLSEGIKIGERTIYNILNKEKNEQNTSFVSAASADENANEFTNTNRSSKRESTFFDELDKIIQENKEEKKTLEVPSNYNKYDLDIDDPFPIKEHVLPIVQNPTITPTPIMQNCSEDQKQFMEIFTNSIRQEVNDGVAKLHKVLAEAPANSENELKKVIKELKNSVKGTVLKASDIKLKEEDMDRLLNETPQEKKIRTSLIFKIRNYVKCFADHETIQYIIGKDPEKFSIKLNSYTIAELKVLYDEIQMGINQSKDWENFMDALHTIIRFIELIGALAFDVNMSGIEKEILSEIDEYDLKQIACELSISRYITPYHRVAIKIVISVLDRLFGNPDDKTGNGLKLKAQLCWTYIKGSLKRYRLAK